VGKGCNFFVQLPQIQTTETTEDSSTNEHSAR
jgi:hypothetical protein